MPRSPIAAGLLVLSLSAAPAGGTADSTLPQLESIEVTEHLHASLALLQEYWLDWLTAYHQRDEERAGVVLADILATMVELDVERLPDLSYGAAVSAVQAARASDFERASWALETAEALDAGRPEVSFAAATVARLEGRRLAAIGQQLDGYLRLLWFPWEREIVQQDIILWTLFVLLLSGALFVVLLASTKGERFYRDLTDLLAERLPRALAGVVAAVVLLLPLALPNGLLWLLVFWTIVFWGYSSRSERAVLVLVWLLLGLVPEIVSRQRQHMAVTMSSPTRVVENLAIARLHGSTLTDLGELRAQLPESVAVKHFLADIHRRFGQLDFGRALYLDVIDAEPANAEATVNLGAFYYYVGDHASAIQHFQRASGRDSLAAAANFNLSQAYSASYLFAQSEDALRAARSMDEDGVSRWMSKVASGQIVTVDGGVARVNEIREELAAARSPAEEPSSLLGRLSRSGSMRMALLVAALAAIAEPLGRRIGLYSATRAGRVGGGSRDEDARGSLVAVLIPGVEAARAEQGHRAFLALLLPVGLLTLPLLRVLGYRIPWGYDPGGIIVWTLAGVGLLLYGSLRVARGLRA